MDSGENVIVNPLSGERTAVPRSAAETGGELGEWKLLPAIEAY